ncbi:MAG: hypothetical protein EOO60_08455 [Hymenobacter sp.]|nr:MAG: hypothetical protein EOO60_08455 [Hymenobacter sp.]
MEIVFDVPAERVAFMLEMLESISYVRNPRLRRARSSKKEKTVSPDEMDTTEYLLSSPANAEMLRRSFEQLERGEYIRVEMPDDLSQPARPI